ncbi:MAG TPA: hypothetical protein VFT53_06690 [Candidatus Saccharimonadales bacterium]|nr:hypothetical protein [Candidatus Saccharimonadales bacterium]
MINLLPTELKDSYRYAHRNTSLLRWVIALVVGMAGLFGLSTAGLIYMQQTTRTYANQASSAQTSLQQQNLSGTQAQVKSISGSLQLAVQVLSKEVLFSKLFTQLAAVMPSNAVLTDLNITQAQTAVNVTADTTDYNAATQLQVNLADPNNKIFSRADIVSITCNTSTSQTGLAAHYPCVVSIRALFATNNPFLLINDKAAQ